MAGQFALDLSRIVKGTNAKIETAARKVMLEAFTGVVQMSPVDTGRFRGAWMVGYGGPNLAQGAPDASGGSTAARIIAEVGFAKIDGRSIFITNSVPYSLRLENGYSGQAPAGMVGVTMTRIASKYGA